MGRPPRRPALLARGVGRSKRTIHGLEASVATGYDDGATTGRTAVYLGIKDDGLLTLDEIDDFGRFHIAAGADDSPAFREFAEVAEEGHYWLDADAIVALSPKAADADWTRAFWNMLETVEPYGFADVKARRIKAHVAPSNTERG